MCNKFGSNLKCQRMYLCKIVAVLIAILFVAGGEACKKGEDEQSETMPISYTEADEILQNYLDGLPSADMKYDFDGHPDAAFWKAFFAQSTQMETEALAELNRVYTLHSSDVMSADSIMDLREKAIEELRKVAAVMSAPQMKEILDRPLVFNGQSIPVVIDRRADEYVGEATCNQNGPVIFMAHDPKPKYRINPYAFLFFREHEFAHLVKGHIICQKGRFGRTGDKEQQKKQELEADCEAVRVLLTFQEGRRIIDRAWSILDGLPLGETSTHPAPKVRAKYIDEFCESQEKH